LLLRTPPALRMTTTRASGSWRSAARRCANWAASGPPALRTSARQACLRSSSCRLSRLPGSATSAANTKRCVARPPHLPSARECGGSQACLWSRGLAYALLTSRPRGASIRTSCRDARTASAATSPQCAASARRCSHALTSREAGVCGTATRITRSSTGSRGTRQSAEVAPPAKAALPAIVARQGGGKKEGGAVEGKGTAHGPLLVGEADRCGTRRIRPENQGWRRRSAGVAPRLGCTRCCSTDVVCPEQESLRLLLVEYSRRW
jgi:hypothetical protein